MFVQQFQGKKSSAFKIYKRDGNTKVSYSEEAMQNDCISGQRLLKKLTIKYLKTLMKCNPQFETFNLPKKYLTYPNTGVYNNGLTNEEHDLIIRVDDIIINERNQSEYIVEDFLGKGTFGQVLSVRIDGNRFALKIIKNLEAYNYQAIQEIKVLKAINLVSDQIVQLQDQFIFKNHLCLLFPLHGYTLLQILQQNQFEGLSLYFIKSVMKDMLKGLKDMHELGIIHGDLKPENILLRGNETDEVVIIDLGSAITKETNYYQYIQSLFYRAPELMLGQKYTQNIDVWSLGCIAVELYLGQPLFSGSSHLDQITQLMGFYQPNLDDLEVNSKYFVKNKLLSKSQYEDKYQVNLPAFYNPAFQVRGFEQLKGYFDHSHQRTSDQIHMLTPFIDFLKQCLQFDPNHRLSVTEALQHPFISGRTQFFMEHLLGSSTRVRSSTMKSKDLSESTTHQSKDTISFQDINDDKFDDVQTRFKSNSWIPKS